MRIKFIIIIFFISKFCFSQPSSVEIFIDYNDVVKELKTNKNDKNLSNKYDLTYVLLLDSSELNLIKKIQPDAAEYFKEYSQGARLNYLTVGFMTEKLNIKDVLLDKVDQKRILDCINIENYIVTNLRFDYPIYIKDNKAIFSISGPSWSNTYYAKLEKHVLQINHFTGIME